MHWRSRDVLSVPSLPPSEQRLIIISTSQGQPACNSRKVNIVLYMLYHSTNFVSPRSYQEHISQTLSLNLCVSMQCSDTSSSSYCLSGGRPSHLWAGVVYPNRNLKRLHTTETFASQGDLVDDLEVCNLLDKSPHFKTFPYQSIPTSPPTPLPNCVIGSEYVPYNLLLFLDPLTFYIFACPLIPFLNHKMK